MNIENLKRALEYIKTLKPEQFDMGSFRLWGSDRGEPECNTIGCIVGHCTVLDAENVRKNYTNENDPFSCKKILFTKWSEDFFDLPRKDDEGIYINNYIWDYLFSGKWSSSKKTNTLAHAIYRFERIIDDGYQPDNVNIEYHREVGND